MAGCRTLNCGFDFGFKEWMDRSFVSRLAGYYCLENRAAIEREADPDGDQ